MDKVSSTGCVTKRKGEKKRRGEEREKKKLLAAWRDVSASQTAVAQSRLPLVSLLFVPNSVADHHQMCPHAH